MYILKCVQTDANLDKSVTLILDRRAEMHGIKMSDQIGGSAKSPRVVYVTHVEVSPWTV
jgi:hypothetical protein